MEIKDNLLAELHSIGAELIEKAQVDAHGVFWETVDLILDEENVLRDRKADISNGVSGIVLFLLDLYDFTKQAKYLDLINSASKWLIAFCREEEIPFSLYNGRIGIALTLLKVYKVTKDESLLEAAKEIIYDTRNSLDEDRDVSPYLYDGLAGIALGLTHYYDRTKDSSILETIRTHVDELIKAARVDKKGLYWGKEPSVNKGMCGYLKGTAGIGYVFFELGRYFSNEAFYFLGQQAFNFENSLLTDSESNWPDVYFPIRNAGELSKYKDNFQKIGDSSLAPGFSNFSLFQGTAGIGLSRLSPLFNDDLSFEKSKYQQDINRAVSTLKDNFSNIVKDDNSYSLDFGAGGPGIFLIELFKRTGNNSILDLASNIARKALLQKSERKFYKPGYDPCPNTDCVSFSMGNTGIGYFYLKLLNPKVQDCVYNFDFDSKYNSCNDPLKNPFKDFDITGLQERILKIVYPKTIEVLDLMHERDNVLQELDRQESFSALRNAFNISTTALAKKLHLDLLEDVLSYEEFKTDLISDINNPLAIYLRQEIAKNQNQLVLEKYSDQRLMKLRYSVSPDLSYFETSWDWDNKPLKEDIHTATNGSSKVAHLFFKESHGFIKYPINELNLILLEGFSKPVKASSIIKELIKEYEGKEKENVKTVLTMQIKELIKANLIIYNKSFSDVFI